MPRKKKQSKKHLLKYFVLVALGVIFILTKIYYVKDSWVDIVDDVTTYGLIFIFTLLTTMLIYDRLRIKLK